jgi:pilus assembly protein CpaF
MATVRASSARDCLQRLEILAGLAGFQGSEDNVRRQIASAVDFVVHVQRLGSGRRVVASISEVTGISDGGTRELFHHELQIDADGREQDRWVGIDLQPRSSKLEAFRRQLRQARGSRS